MKQDLIFPELSYKIVGILFDVFNQLGYGYQERYYQKAIAGEFKKNNISFREQVIVPIECGNSDLGRYYLDFLVDNKVILEIKRGEFFSRFNINQVYAYLKASNIRLGILANFTSKGIKFKRILNIK